MTDVFDSALSIFHKKHKNASLSAHFLHAFHSNPPPSFRHLIYGNKSTATAGSWMTHEIDYTEVHRTLPSVLRVEAALQEEVCFFFCC